MKKLSKSKGVILYKTYKLDLQGSAPVAVKPIRFTENGVVCLYLKSSPGRIETIELDLFINSII